MTLQQLKYVVTVARTGSMSEASKELFISQPGLTTSIRELETEMGIKIFTRTNKGVVTSNEGERFLGYARQVLEQASLLEGVYKSGTKIKQQFCVSTQHYSFAVNAFVDLIRRFAGEEYDFSLRETETYEIIDDVAKMKSNVQKLKEENEEFMKLLKTLESVERGLLRMERSLSDVMVTITDIEGTEEIKSTKGVKGK